MHKHTAAEHDELMQYLREQHGMNYIPNVSWLLKDEEHHVVLKNDQHLHEKLQLPDYIRVVKEGNLLHEQLDGQKYHPRFATVEVVQHPLTQQAEPGEIANYIKHNPGFVSGHAQS